MFEPGLNLLALLPCPVKVPVEQAFDDFLATLSPQRAAALSCRLEGNANVESDYYRTIEDVTALEMLPDIIVSPGFNSFFEQAFVTRFIRTGLFTSVSCYAGDEHLSRLGVIDPGGHYTMLATNLLVPVADLQRLGDRPLPRRWADLLESDYAESLAIRGNRDGTFCETLLLTLHKEAGADGLRALGRNVRFGWHPSQMVKAMLSSNADAPAISVMPLFFANTIRNRDNVSIVWPADGALVSPVTMLVKAEKQEELKKLIAFLNGPEVAAICAGAAFPALHPAVDNRLPEHAVFKWIGWDYVKNHDLKALIADTNAAFLRAFRGEGS